MVISQVVTLRRIRRDQSGKPVVPRRYNRYAKAERLDRPPMLYLEIKYEDGSNRNTAFVRTGPDEYTEIIKGETKDGA